MFVVRVVYSFVRSGSASKLPTTMVKHNSTASLVSNPSDLQLAFDAFGDGFGHLQNALPGTIFAVGVAATVVANEVMVTVSGVVGASSDHLAQSGYFA